MTEFEQGRQRAQMWFDEQASRGLAHVTRRPAKGKIVHDVVIEGARFGAVVFYDSILVGVDDSFSAPLGVACINDKCMFKGSGWGICKYRNERHSPLNLSAQGRRSLALEFGLPIYSELSEIDRRTLREPDFFYASPAFQSLVVWARDHPRMVRKSLGDDYLGMWPLSAIRGQRQAATPENLAFARNGYKDL